MKMKIATCQFPIGGDIARNLRSVLGQMREAHRRGAHVAHFPECALSGYAGLEYPSFRGFDWQALTDATRQVMALAGRLRLWVVLGSSHRLSGRHRPHNSLYVIDDRGRLVDRYDKMFCTGHRRASGGDLDHYSPGDHFVTFKVRGIVCGLQICHDMRYQELYRECRRRGVQVMFHAYHNGHVTPAVFRRGNIWGVIVPATMQTYAANNAMWISASNTSARISYWPSFCVRPDGSLAGRLAVNRAGVLLTTVDTALKIYDASREWRDRAMNGIYHSGATVRDARSRERRRL
jgi:deaminated glutathione amidase